MSAYWCSKYKSQQTLRGIIMMSNPLRIFLSLICLISFPVYAASVNVTWQDPDNYADVRPGNETRDGFRERVFKDLDQVFVKNAKKLPDDLELNLVVTNLDLAGDTLGYYTSSGFEIRIVKDIYWPRMSLTYSLKNKQGVEISGGKADLADMNFLFFQQLNITNSGFRYEEKMINDWFKTQIRQNAFHIN
jgi:hypothetical protein